MIAADRFINFEMTIFEQIDAERARCKAILAKINLNAKIAANCRRKLKGTLTHAARATYRAALSHHMNLRDSARKEYVACQTNLTRLINTANRDERSWAIPGKSALVAPPFVAARTNPYLKKSVSRPSEPASRPSNPVHEDDEYQRLNRLFIDAVSNGDMNKAAEYKAKREARAKYVSTHGRKKAPPAPSASAKPKEPEKPTAWLTRTLKLIDKIDSKYDRQRFATKAHNWFKYLRLPKGKSNYIYRKVIRRRNFYWKLGTTAKPKSKSKVLDPGSLV